MASVDVVIPNYNYGRYLRVCIESVLAQDVDELRVLVVDNASTDESRDIAREVASRDSRVELLLRAENLGPHASFNAGIDWARSDYFLMLFSDDFLVPGALRRAARVLDRDPSIAFTYGRDVPVRNDEAIPEIEPQPEDVPCQVQPGSDFIRQFCRLGVFQIPGPSIVIRTSVQKQVGYYLPALPHSDDYHVWLRLALHGRVAELDCIQAGIRLHGANRVSELLSHPILHIQHTAQAAEYFFTHEARDLPTCAELRQLAQRGIAERAYWSAISHLLRRQPGARDLLRLAFSLRPRTRVLPPIGYLLERPDTARRISGMLGLRARA